MSTLLALLGCTTPDLPPPVDLSAPDPLLAVALDYPRWPEPGTRLTAPQATFPEDFGVRKVYLDAGHGSARNSGNTSAYCEKEADIMVALTGPLAEALEATGHFEVRTSRQPGEEVPYRSRLTEARDWGAEAFISLHSDSRGMLVPWRPTGDQWCYQSTDTPGFSVLWSDEGSAALSAQRLSLARSLSGAMASAGFLPYDGGEYVGLYAPDDAVPGVFVDRHEPRRRIMFLRRPTMPSVIIETHHALDPDAAARFREPETIGAFHAAVIAGLADWFR